MSPPALPCTLALIIAQSVAFVVQQPQSLIQPSPHFLLQASSYSPPPFLNFSLNGDRAIVGAGTLGDIMAGSGSKDDFKKPLSSTTIVDGLVTREGGELNARFNCNFSPMERVALTANGNLQRIFSSYYDAPVHIQVESCSRRKAFCTNEVEISQNGWFNDTMHAQHVVNSDAVWERVVHITVHDQQVCKATSIISIKSPYCIRLIEDGAVGLGQMFRYLNKLPTFSLLDAGKTAPKANAIQGGMWRTYVLQCEEMTCLIHEDFLSDTWNIISENEC